eukprot:2699104-Prymnesium_polylepis.3
MEGGLRALDRTDSLVRSGGKKRFWFERSKLVTTSAALTAPTCKWRGGKAQTRSGRPTAHALACRPAGDDAGGAAASCYTLAWPRSSPASPPLRRRSLRASLSAGRREISTRRTSGSSRAVNARWSFWTTRRFAPAPGLRPQTRALLPRSPFTGA